MTTITQRMKTNKRRRQIQEQPEETLFQNQDPYSRLTSQQKGLIFEEECQEQLRLHGISCTVSSASRWSNRNQELLYEDQREHVLRISTNNQSFELLVQGDHGIDAFGHSKERQYIAQFKNHKKPIGPGDVRDFIGTLSAYKNTIGLFISKNGFTKNAICEFEASSQPIIYDTHIPLNIKELMKQQEPLSITQALIKAEYIEEYQIKGTDIHIKGMRNVTIHTHSMSQ
jgi:hypothetical protein